MPGPIRSRMPRVVPVARNSQPISTEMALNAPPNVRKGSQNYGGTPQQAGRTGRPRRVDVPRCPGDQRTMVWVQRNGGDPNHRVACDCCGPSGPERVGTKNSVEDAGDQQEGITARQEGAVATPCFRRLCPWLNPANSFSFSSHAAATATGSLRRSGRREKRGI
jgi:hypothetical protein